MKPIPLVTLRKMRVLDGALATELEARGADISSELWSAQVLETHPELITAVHRAYAEAGADCLSTASYQVSRRGYAGVGYRPEQADEALRRSVALAVAVKNEFISRQILVAASLGPYGAVLHNGAEYHGNYGISFQELVRFHKQRIAVLVETEADLLAIETLPSLAEAEAVVEALSPFPQVSAWVSFTCRNTRDVAHGEPIAECCQLLEKAPQVVAMGINCTAPPLVGSLLRHMREVTEKPLLAYPNSGEKWDSTHRSWYGSGDAANFCALAEDWYRAGAQAVGGCCRTGPEHIRRLAALAKSLSA